MELQFTPSYQLLYKISIDDKNKHLLLDLSEISSQKSKEISQYLKKIIIEYNIPIIKLNSIVSDNCNSMVKSILDLEYDLKNDTTENEESELLSEDQQFLMEEELSFNNISSMNEIKDNLFNGKVFIKIGCVIHKLQLILKISSLKNIKINSILEKLKKTIVILRKSEHKEAKIIIPQPIVTRWNSHYISLKKFMMLKEKYFLYIDSINNNKLKEEIISSEDITELHYIEKILSKFHEMTKKLENEKGNLANFHHLFYQFYLKLKNNLTNPNIPSVIKSFMTSIIFESNRLFEQFFNNHDEMILVMYFIDPCLCIHLSSTEKKKASNLFEQLYNSDEEIKGNRVKMTEDFLGGFLSSDDANNNNENKGILSEISSYRKYIRHFKVESKNFWAACKQKFPRIYEVNQFFSTLGSANGRVERLFSVAKSYSVWKKNRISLKMIECRIINNILFETLNF